MATDSGTDSSSRRDARDDDERKEGAPEEGVREEGMRKEPARPEGARSSNARSARRRSRELALQGLYEWLAGGAEAGVIDAHMREQDDFERCDAAHFAKLLHGCIEQAATLDAALARHVDRKTQALSPVEHAVLLIGAFELQHCVDIPYRVVINEGVELAKSFGGTDGHKYVNGVLDKVAGDLRAAEVSAKKESRKHANAPGPNRSSA